MSINSIIAVDRDHHHHEDKKSKVSLGVIGDGYNTLEEGHKVLKTSGQNTQIRR